LSKVQLFAIIILGLFGCSQQSPTTNIDFPVISLQKQLPLLLERAQIWDEKAYLYSVDIPIFYYTEENYLWLIEANFRSIDKPKQSLNVTLEVDGTINIHHIQHSKQITHYDPISFDDGLLDSTQAINIFLNDEVIRSLKAREWASLFLEHDSTQISHPVVWRLSLNMMSTQGKHFFIDAFTGEELQISR
jgi:hypothetical protein